MTDQKQKVVRRITASAVLAALALPLTGYLIYAHYNQEASKFCNFGESFNCEIVNQSIYAEIFGIPVAILGFIAYLTLLFLALTIRKALVTGYRKKYSPETLIKVFTILAGAGVAFSLYLTYVEAFILMTWCVFCVAQQIIIFAILILSLSALHSISSSKKQGGTTTCEFC